MAQTHTGNCFCGELELEVTGEPKAQGDGLLHCSSCRSAGPVNAFTLWDLASGKVAH